MQEQQIDYLSIFVIVLSVNYCFSSFLSGCDQISRFQSLAVVSILWLRIKTLPRSFCGKHARLVAALG
jgi:hypothetical protein